MDKKGVLRLASSDGFKLSSLTVVIPVYNEAGVIAKSLTCLSSVLSDICLDYEIIVVNDGSIDGTKMILDQLMGSIPCLKVLHNECNQGLGGALKVGFMRASKEFVFYTDADMPFQYSEIVRAAQMMENSGVDVLVGYRLNRVKEGVLRRVCSIAYNCFVRMVFGVGLRDINCAFKLVRRDVFQMVDLKSSGSFIDAELVVKAKYHGFSLEEFGVEYHPRQEGDSRLFRVLPIAHTFREMFMLYRSMVCLKRNVHKTPRVVS